MNRESLQKQSSGRAQGQILLLQKQTVYAKIGLMSEKQTFSPEALPSRKEQELRLFEIQAEFRSVMDEFGLSDKVKQMAISKYGEDMVNAGTTMVPSFGFADKRRPYSPVESALCIQVRTPALNQFDTIARTGEKVPVTDVYHVGYVQVQAMNKESGIKIEDGFNEHDAYLVGKMYLALSEAKDEGILPNLSADLTEIEQSSDGFYIK